MQQLELTERVKQRLRDLNGKIAAAQGDLELYVQGVHDGADLRGKWNLDLERMTLEEFETEPAGDRVNGHNG